MRKQVSRSTDFSVLIEQYAENLLDICAEERRLVKTLARLRGVKAGLVAGLAKVAKAESRRR